MKTWAYKGERLTIAEIARRENTTQVAIYFRLRRYGSAEVCKRPHRYEYHGEQLTIAEIAEREGVTWTVIDRRLRMYGSAETLGKRGLPPKHVANAQRYEYNGKMCTIAEIAAVEMVSKQAIRQRIDNHGSPYKKTRLG